MRLPTAVSFVIMITTFAQERVDTCPSPQRKHPTRCDKYIVCEIDRNGYVQDQVMECSFGTLYDTNHGCVAPGMSDCKDRCSPDNTGLTYKGAGNCRGYWECVEGKPEARCCDPKIRFENGRCSHTADENCIDTCFGEALIKPTRCDKIGSADKKSFKQITSDGLQYFSCPLGTLYVEKDCGCNRTDSMSVQPGQCRPEVFIKFTEPYGVIRDSSGKNNYVSSTGVVVQADGQARFEGNGSIDIPRFNNLDGLKYFYIAITYTLITDSFKAAIVSNECRDIGYSILLYENTNVNVVRFTTKTKGKSKIETASVALKAGKKRKEKNVVYTVKNGYLIGFVQRRRRRVPAPGLIDAIKCGLKIGSADGLPGFSGTMRYITIYLC